MAWAGAYGVQKYMLRCANDLAHEGIKRPYSPTINEERLKTMVNNTGVTIRGNAVTEIQARTWVNQLWGDAPDPDKAKAVIICTQYGLNPLAKHLYLIPFNVKVNKKGEPEKWGTKWEIVYAIKAKRLIAYNSRPETSFGYEDKSPRLMTPDEEKQIYGAVDDKFYSAITILLDDKGRRYYGSGRWPKATDPYGSDKGNSGQHMAQIRSESDALERYAPSGLPNMQIIDSEYLEIEDTRKTIAESDSKVLFDNEDPKVGGIYVNGVKVDKLPERKSEPEFDFKDTIEKLAWPYAEVRDYLRKTYGVKGVTPSECIASLSPADKNKFITELKRRLEAF